MALFDMPLAELRTYLPAREEAPDFDAFWQESLSEARRQPVAARFEPVDFGLRTVHTFEVTFAGYGGQAIKGWFQVPRYRREPLPCVVEYVGYPGGRGYPFDWLLWSSLGYAHLLMDNRGQGGAWRPGATPDVAPPGAGPYCSGYVTQGILDPHTYYYRRLLVDAVRAVEAARTHPTVDPARIALHGRSQGGGMALAVGGLDASVSAVMADVPFLCHYRRAVEITDANPYSEIAEYLKCYRDRVDAVFATLSYFDGVNFAARARAAALFSTGLMDQTCPPSTVLAAFNHYAGPKKIKVWPYNDHEGGECYQTLEKIQFLKDLWGSLDG